MFSGDKILSLNQMLGLTGKLHMCSPASVMANPCVSLTTLENATHSCCRIQPPRLTSEWVDFTM